MKLSVKQDSKICEAIALDNGNRIVLIDVAGDKTVSNAEKLSNIYHIDSCNNIIWQIQETKTKPPFDNDTFMYLKKNQNNEIIAARFSGFVYKIDPKTGEAEQTGFRK